MPRMVKAICNGLLKHLICDAARNDDSFLSLSLSLADSIFRMGLVIYGLMNDLYAWYIMHGLKQCTNNVHSPFIWHWYSKLTPCTRSSHSHTATDIILEQIFFIYTIASFSVPLSHHFSGNFSIRAKQFRCKIIDIVLIRIKTAIYLPIKIS